MCQNYWAGVPVAFPTNVGTPLPTLANNAPIGQLILQGGDNNSDFHFQGVNGDTVNPYAMYVDQIVMDGATNTNSAGKFTAFNIDPNVTIYFLKATIGTNSISPALAGQAAGGGQLVWLNNNVGHFSATKVTYADGQTFAVNSAYVQAYGLPSEPPVPLTPQTIQLQIGTTNVNSTPKAAISQVRPGSFDQYALFPDLLKYELARADEFRSRRLQRPGEFSGFNGDEPPLQGGCFPVPVVARVWVKCGRTRPFLRPWAISHDNLRFDRRGGYGKSTSGRFLGERGLAVVDTDVIARQLVEPGQPALAEIQTVFGPGMLGADVPPPAR